MSPRAQQAGLAFTFVLVAAGVIVQVAVLPPGARAAGRSQDAARTAAAMEHRMRPETRHARNVIAPTAPASAAPAVREEAPLHRAVGTAQGAVPAHAAVARPEASPGSTRAAQNEEVHPAAEAAASSSPAVARPAHPDAAAMPQPSGPPHGEAARSPATVNAVALVPAAAQPRQDPKTPSSPADDRAPAPLPLPRHGAGSPQAPGETIEETPEPALQRTQLSLLGPATGRQNELLTYAVVVENAQAVSHAPLRLTFDPGVLAFVEATEGDFLSTDGSATQFLASAADTPGLVDIALSRLGAGPGVGGGGTICTVTFRVVGPGVSSIAISGSRLLDASSRPVGFRRNDSHVAVD